MTVSVQMSQCEVRGQLQALVPAFHLFDTGSLDHCYICEAS